MKRIAIIGAGVSGLSCASLLTNQDYQVTVYEKSRGSGGRLSSKKVNDSSWDMGAQFISANSAEFSETLKSWEEKGWITEWQEHPWVINKAGMQPSPDNKTRYVGLPRMTGLSRQLLSQVHEFMPTTRIVDAQFSDGQWQLRSENDTLFSGYDGLIISAPPEQTLALIPDSSHLKSDIEHCAMLPCWTLLLSFEKRIETDLNMAFVKDSPIGWIARNNSKPGRHQEESWVIQASHAWSKAHQDADKNQVLAELKDAFFKLLNSQAIAHNEEWIHRWLYAIPDATSKVGAYYDASHNLAICGDWCQQGSVEGAWISGQKAAQLLGEKLK